MRLVNFFRIYLFIHISVFFIACNTNTDLLIISKKDSKEKYLGKVEEINVYYSEPINICFEMSIDNSIQDLVKSMDVDFCIKFKGSICNFYNFYRIDNNMLNICVYTDFLDCNYIHDGIFTDKQKRKRLFNEIEFYIIDNKTKREFAIDLSETKVLFNEVDNSYQRPL